MDFELPEEYRMLQETVRRFVRQELIPLETTVLERDTQGMTGEDLVPPEAEERLLSVAQEAGLWGLDVPEEFGGLNLGALPKCLATEELYKDYYAVYLSARCAQSAHADANLHARAAREIPPPVCAGQGAFGYCHFRTWSWIRPGRDADLSREKRGPVGNKRSEDLDLTRPCRRLHHCHGSDGEGQRCPWWDYGLPGG